MQNKQIKRMRERKWRGRGRGNENNSSQPPLCTPDLTATDLAPGCSLDSFQWGLAVNTKDQESAMKVNVKVPQSV